MRSDYKFEALKTENKTLSKEHFQTQTFNIVYIQRFRNEIIVIIKLLRLSFGSCTIFINLNTKSERF